MKWRFLFVLICSISGVAVAGCGGQTAEGFGRNGLQPEAPAGGDSPFFIPGPAADPASPADPSPAAPLPRAPSSPRGQRNSGADDPCDDVRRVRVEAADRGCFIGEKCDGALEVTRGTGSYRWRGDVPPALPDGLAWNGFSFSGAPTKDVVHGVYEVEVAIDDSACEGKGDRETFTITVDVRPLPEASVAEAPPRATPVPPVLSLEASPVFGFFAQGGNGGTPFESRCPQDQVVSQIDLRSEGYVDQIRISCELVATLDQNGVDPVVAGGAYGGNGGQPSVVAAPLGFAFVGWNVRSGGYIDNLEPIASRVTGSGVNDAVEWSGGRHGGSGGSDRQEIRCGADAVLTGIRGASGGYVDRLGLICTRVNAIAPRPPTSFSLREERSPTTVARVNGGGRPCALSCIDRGHPAGMVSGFLWARAFNGWGNLGHIELQCASLESDGRTDPASAWSTGRCGGGGLVESTLLFPKGYAAVGLAYRASARLDSITATLEPASLFRDPLADEWGEDGSADVTIQTERMGGDGGNQQATIECGEGAVMTGITFAAGGEVDDIISFTCAGVD